MNRDFLQGHCIVNIKREALGFGDAIALTAAFRELKKINPQAYTVLSIFKLQIDLIKTLMEGQPYPDRIISYNEIENLKNYANATKIPYFEYDLTNANYLYEQKEKSNVTKSRARVFMNALELFGESKPHYQLLEEDLAWVDSLKLPPWFVLVQLKGREPYKYCNEETLKTYCKKIQERFTVVILSDSTKVQWPKIISVIPSDIRKAIALMARSICIVGFDSVFLHASAALNIPFVGFLGPTTCTGRLSDHVYAESIRSHEDCLSCFRESMSNCRITGEKDRSACLYDIDPDKILEVIQSLHDARSSMIGSIMGYKLGQYYPETFKPIDEGFIVDTKDLSKVRQPVHDDLSYKEAYQEDRVKWLLTKAITDYGILEIGCANGYIINRFQPPLEGFRHCGIDIDSARIKRAKATKKRSIDFYQINAVNGLPFKDNVFSTVLLPEILEHLDFEDAKEVLKEAYRVTNSKVLITMPYCGEDYRKNIERIRIIKDRDHKWLVTTDKLMELLAPYNHTIQFTMFALVEIKKG